ncbi:MAG: serine/threonine-protein phosphatase [Oscillospiraceae bacterium]|nr:serine/threonine-protein phosphatase [Oscillospiraceae bacterium]
MESGKKMRITAAQVCDVGKRPTQEDSWCISDISDTEKLEACGLFAVVADGMGGLASGDLVSACVVNSLAASFEAKESIDSPVDDLYDMLQQCSSNVNEMLGPDGVKQSGSTVIVALVHKDMLYWAAVGDSHICLYRNGVLTLLNQEHNYGLELDRCAVSGKISFDDAQLSIHRKELVSYMGMGELKHIDRNIRPFPLHSGDKVILMTDGVYTTLSDAELAAVLNKNVYDAAELLQAGIYEKDVAHQDNYTAIILGV